MAALNRNGIDIERRARRRGVVKKRGVGLAAWLKSMLEAAGLIESSSPRLPLLKRPLRSIRPHEFPHVPAGTPWVIED